MAKKKISSELLKEVKGRSKTRKRRKYVSAKSQKIQNESKMGSNINIKLTDFGPSNLSGSRLEKYWSGIYKNDIEIYRPGLDKEINLADTEKIIDKFGIKFIEYGNWVNQNQRLNFTLAGLASLYDLSKVLGFKSIGKKTLGISFGARGMGGNASAHFEPSNNVINLTKTKGWQSFGHEYGHFIDYFIGGYVKKEQSKETFALSYGQSCRTLITKIDKKTQPARFWTNEIVNFINQLQHEKLLKFTNNRTGSYWSRRTEIFARAFEVYLAYKLKELKIKNLFLTKHKYSKNGVYLNENEIHKLLPHFEKLIFVIKPYMNS